MNKLFFKRCFKKLEETQEKIKILFRSLDKPQKKLVIGLVVVMVITSLMILSQLRTRVLLERPVFGGTWKEGIVGSPRFINPILATSNTDRDITNLVHAGLVKRNFDGSYANDLAEKYELNKNELVYTFTIKDDARFHNGEKVTADDVIFTIEKIKDPLEKSPKAIEWQGVGVSKVDEVTVVFTLRQPFNDFLDLATVGIVPKSVYGKYSTNNFNQAEENIKAIGAGPYKITKIKNTKNTPREITLEKFKSRENEGYIKKIVLNFYETEQGAINAFQNKKVDNIGGISGREAKVLEERGYEMTTAILPRIFGIFINTQNKNSILNQPQIAKVVDNAIDKQYIIDSVLNGFGVVSDLPLPANLSQEISKPKENYDIQKTLESNGWKLDENNIWTKTTTVKKETTSTQLAFTITTSDTPELRLGAEKIAENLREKGILVNIISYDNTTLEEKIKNREYEALYYGIQIVRESQVYAFWHSSQREHPGLNISLYTNSRVDTILENIQKEKDLTKRKNEWEKFAEIFKGDLPAIFIYSPSYTYIHRNKILFEMPEYLNTASDRFINITNWYLQTEKVLPFLYKK